MMGMTADEARMFQLFFPHAAASYMRVLQNQTRFVQYTQAESAMKMLRSKSVWMRKALWMNDYREIDHGWELLLDTYRDSEAGKGFRAVLDEAFPGIIKEITDNFDPWVDEYLHNTYVACVSEHDASEDVNGRLSMWRAYGGTSGVAFVLKPTPFTTASHALGSYSSPVAYFSKADVEAHFDKIAAAIRGDLDFVKSQSRPSIVARIHEAFRYGMICCKHPGFSEEREWRIVYNPQRDIIPKDKRPIEKRIEIVSGTPQPLYALPLKKFDDGYDLTPAAILDRIIIGPARYPGALLEAFWDELEAAGVPDPKKKVVLSDVPLRV